MHYNHSSNLLTTVRFQQSPTKELAEHGFSPEAETSGQGSESKQPTSDDSSDGNISEESKYTSPESTTYIETLIEVNRHFIS